MKGKRRTPSTRKSSINPSNYQALLADFDLEISAKLLKGVPGSLPEKTEAEAEAVGRKESVSSARIAKSSTRLSRNRMKKSGSLLFSQRFHGSFSRGRMTPKQSKVSRDDIIVNVDRPENMVGRVGSFVLAPDNEIEDPDICQAAYWDALPRSQSGSSPRIIHDTLRTTRDPASRFSAASRDVVEDFDDLKPPVSMEMSDYQEEKQDAPRCLPKRNSFVSKEESQRVSDSTNQPLDSAFVYPEALSL